MRHLIGTITLNLSFFTYLVLYLPQVIHNLRRKSTEGLSFLMHVFLVIGYMADVMYGFGRHMQLQYRLVSIIGLICLAVQHFQFGYYHKPTWKYISVTFLLFSYMGYVLYSLLGPVMPAQDYIDAGYIAWGVGVVYTLPQVWKNYRFSSTLGVSILFIVFDILSSTCDSISAWCLHWDLPSRMGSPIEAALGVLLLVQTVYFSQKRLRSDNDQSVIVTS